MWGPNTGLLCRFFAMHLISFFDVALSEGSGKNFMNLLNSVVFIGFR